VARTTARHGQPRRAPTITVGFVTALAGLLFATNARLLSAEGSNEPGLLGLVREEGRKVAALETAGATLAEDIDSLAARAIAGDGDKATPGVDLASHLTQMAGPGVRVTMDDAAVPDGEPGPLDAFVIHQQDLEAVLNTLWAAGAEAVAVQSVRLTSVTSVQCVGNVLLVGGRTFSPPYRIEAIGDPEKLVEALDSSPLLGPYRQAADELGLGWSVETSEGLRLPGTTGGSISLRYATARGSQGGGVP
jgi:uncharacterized protein YlxW (UPF0749 family)